MPKSVLEAIKQGVWDFEPEQIEESGYESTGAMPGTNAKLGVLVARAEAGLPLWHNSDRTDSDDELLPSHSTEKDMPRAET